MYLFQEHIRLKYRYK